MYLEGQYGSRTKPDAGYAMAALLAVIAIWSVVWLLAVPVWKQAVQREKEEELIWRAGQYARAVALYQRKYANAFPPTVDVLMREKFLRKKYKDPITKGDFRLLSPVELQTMPGMTTTTPGIPGRTGPGGAGQPRLPGGNTGMPGTGLPGGNVPPEGLPTGPGLSPRPGGFSQPTGLGPNAGPAGGIAAAVSKSTAQSIKVFKNRRQYNQWIVTVQDVMPRGGVGIQPGQQPGQVPPGAGAPGLSPGTSPGSSPGFPSRRP
jgi:type II secretory pathway pseudopilin PulG